MPHNKYHNMVPLMKSGSNRYGGGPVVRWCWVNFRYQGFLLIWFRVGQGPTVLVIGAGGGCLDFFFFLSIILFSFFLSLGDGPI